MSTPLPLVRRAAVTPAAVAGEGSADQALPVLSGRVEVFDPPMCCPTGLCGPGVDPALLVISRDLRWLEKHGVNVRRIGLASDPDAFVSNARVAGLMAAFGDGALPATLVSGTVLVHGRYPQREELLGALARNSSSDDPAPGQASGDVGCCTPGSGCC